MENLKEKILTERIKFLKNECEAKTIYISMLEKTLNDLKEVIGFSDE